MAEYIDKSEVLELKRDYGEGQYSMMLIDPALVKKLPTTDVVERDKIKQAIEEIEQTLYVDSLIFGELIDFKDGKISADDVIEEFNRVTRKEVLEILKRNIEE